MHYLECSVAGTSPLLMNSAAGLGTAAPGEVPTPEVEAERGTYRHEDGTLWFPAAAFRGALVSAGAGHKIGKRFARSLLAGTVFATDEAAALTDPDTGKPVTEYTIDVRRCVPPGARGGVSVLRARPRLDAWAASFALEYDETMVDPQTILHFLEIAGRSIGVGNFRPAKGGWFGRFAVRDPDDQ
jgi:hypothetical protein